MKCNKSNYIKRLKRKKEDALEFIVDEYLGFVKGCVCKILGPSGKTGAIEECINDIFLAVWNHAEQFEGNEEDFKKWIYKISKYQAIDYYRKLSRVSEIALEDKVIVDEKSTEEHIILNETKEELISLINTLKPIDQKIFTMKYFLGIQSQEIGMKLGMTQTAVDNRVYRGKKKLIENNVKIGWGEL